VRRKPYSVVLLDEIEKAHPDVFNILLQMLEEGRLTDAQGRHVDFRNTIVIMTSNIGASSIAKNTQLGFSVEESETGVSYEDMKNRIMGDVKKVFRPELLNRIDEIIVFQKLTKEEITQIVDLLMKRLREQMKLHEVSIELTNKAKDFMVDKGYDPTMGARPLRRAIQRYIEDPLADFVLGRALEPGSTVLVDHRDGDEEISLQMIEPVKVPDAPPEDLVPTPADADDAQTDDSGSEPEQPAEPTE
jgi:ATP-dependent Clp protease ATP-binding subunit ClpC